ncbi:hypothetical protein EYF80_027600 [Liparis tanakae]|uniref:Uncharacterized protein n=1 Tax=Liparis tanakae TaxID=230148 RepID=A0A4Z2H9M5_9TELE|nr:hypothetical protein EYF80_027600 [Liparis tanakae]
MSARGRGGAGCQQWGRWAWELAPLSGSSEPRGQVVPGQLTAGPSLPAPGTELLRCKGCTAKLAVWRDGALAERRIGPNRLE